MKAHDDEIVEKLRELLSEAVDKAIPEQEKKIRNIADDLAAQVEWALRDQLAGELVYWVRELAGRSVEAILNGNEEELRRYLSCEKRGEDGQYIGWTGRAAGYHFAPPSLDRVHPVIRGKLFEQGAIALRKKIVDAHAAVLKTERILDLEDQLASVIAKNNELEHTAEKLREQIYGRL